MGCYKSPPFFCAGSETARDIISDLVKGNTTLTWHKFENIMIPNSLHYTMPEKLVDIIEVFFDDFIGAKNKADLTHLLHLSLCMLHGIHAFSPLSEVTQHGGGDSVSDKKDKQRGRNTVAQEINTRLDLQWPGIHTVSTSGKKSKNPRTASEHQEVHDENT